ncbi:MAG TPA: amidohydrolase [Symbiobacteriaceae bacterium]|nr:amidohydrolase [Symbiobacteriaceae bacterium]
MSERVTEAQALSDRLIAIRRELHQHPELSLEEIQTTARLRQWLTEAGIRILDLPLATGLIAEVGGQQPGPTIAIRTDIDALPIPEQTGLSFASLTPGKMHACGHDFHMATVLGAALLLKAEEASLQGTVRFFFQPAEEIGAGAKLLIEAGAMAGVAAVFGAHNKPDLAAGLIGIKEGPLMSAVDSFLIEVTGVGGHGALPHTTKDPVVASAAIILSLQTIVSRWASPQEAAVVSVTTVRAGEGAHNVIPDRVTLKGTIRTFNTAVHEGVKERIAEIATSVARAHGCTVSVSYPLQGLPSVNNHPAAVAVAQRACEALGLPVAEAVPTLASEDFSLYQVEAPGCFVWIGTGCAFDWHHPEFRVDEGAMSRGAAYFAQVAVEALATFR